MEWDNENHGKNQFNTEIKKITQTNTKNAFS